MAFKQPRVPEYREASGTGKYLKELTIFLKDFCLNSWKATTNLEKGGREEISIEELDAQLERLRLDREHPVGGAPYLTLLPREEDDPNVKWPWSKWTLDTSGRFFLGASEAHPLGETGGEETHTLTAEEMPQHIHSAGSDDNGKAYVFLKGVSGTVSRRRVVQGGTSDPIGATVDSVNNLLVSSTDTSAAGSGAAHNNMPPYMTINIWIRTA